MKRSELVNLVKEMLDEANVTNVGGASFTPGDGAQYATPSFLGKATKAIKTLKKQGYKQVSRPKRPSHTKAFDYL
jgi:hypothetical protein